MKSALIRQFEEIYESIPQPCDINDLTIYVGYEQYLSMKEKGYVDENMKLTVEGYFAFCNKKITL